MGWPWGWDGGHSSLRSVLDLSSRTVEFSCLVTAWHTVGVKVMFRQVGCRAKIEEALGGTRECLACATE